MGTDSAAVSDQDGLGLMLMLRWILDIGILKSILPNWVTMKFTTALSFNLSGVIVYSIA